MKQKLSKIIISISLIAFALLFANTAFAARVNDSWNERLGSYLETAWNEGRNILINGVNKYLNFGSISGSSGYGFRDNGGTIECKNSGGSWSACQDGTGSGGGSFPFSVLSWGNATSTTLGFLDGFISTASSTINAALHLTSLSQGGLYTGSGGLIGTFATTTASCTGSATCNPFTIIGSSPITISATGGSGSGNVSTSTGETAGNLAYWTSTNATPALLGKVATSSKTCTAPLSCTGFDVVGSGSGAITLDTTGLTNLGQAWEINSGGFLAPTTTIGVKITNTGAGDSFVVEDSASTDTTPFVITATGSVGIGTTTPFSNFQIHTPSVTNFRESIMRAKVSDGGNSLFEISNGTSVDNRFIPTFMGYVDSANSIESLTFRGLISSGNDTSDSAANGVVNFSVFRTSDSSNPNGGTFSNPVNRKLFSFNNQSGPLMTITASGNVGIGTTTPSDKLTINGNGRIENQGQLKFSELRANGNQMATISATSSMTSDVNWTLPATDGTNGQFLATNGVGNLYFASPAGGGTVTSVAQTVPTGLTITGSPVTGAGTLAIGLDTGYVIPLQSTLNTYINALATSTNETAGRLAYFTTTSGSPAKLADVATTTLTVSAPLSLDQPVAKVGGVNSILTCTTASSGVAGCLSNTAFDTFNGKESVLTFGWPLIRSTNAISFGGLSTSSNAVIGNIPYFSGVNTFANVATSSKTCTAPLSCTSFDVLTGGGAITLSTAGTWSGNAVTATTLATGNTINGTSFTGASPITITAASSTLLADNNTWTKPQNYSNATSTLFSATTAWLTNLITGAGSVDLSASTVKQHLYPAFSYATSTAWTGTTTIYLAPSYQAETWNGVKCETDVGTLNVSFYDGTNRMNMLSASTTIGTFSLTTNNSFTAGESRRVDIGTPATAPTRISCSVDKTIN